MAMVARDLSDEFFATHDGRITVCRAIPQGAPFHTAVSLHQREAPGDNTDGLGTMEGTMNFNQLFVAIPAALFILGNGVANAGTTVKGAGAVACVNDKWHVSEPETGHKLVDYAGRCVFIPNDAAAEKATQDCVGNFEYMPDGSYKANGTCTHTFKNGDKRYHKWEEGTHVKERGRFTITGGTGKLDGVRGSGTYALDKLTDTLEGGTYTEKVELP